MKRSTFVAASLAAVLLPFASLAQSDWPNRPITFIVPYPPGGLNDALQQFIDPADAFKGLDGIERIQPFTCFRGVSILTFDH